MTAMTTLPAGLSGGATGTVRRTRPPRPKPPRGSSPVEFHLAIALQRYRGQAEILRTHRPSRRRFRIVRFAGFPIPALITRCQHCGCIWPCRTLFELIRTKLGWTSSGIARAIALIRKNVDIRPDDLLRSHRTDPG